MEEQVQRMHKRLQQGIRLIKSKKRQRKGCQQEEAGWQVDPWW